MTLHHLAGFKSLCCTSPIPYTNCDWYGRNGINLKLQLKCTGSCPAGKYPIAVDPSWCNIGTNQFCCDVPTSLVSSLSTSQTEKLQIKPCSNRNLFSFLLSRMTPRWPTSSPNCKHGQQHQHVPQRPSPNGPLSRYLTKPPSLIS